MQGRPFLVLLMVHVSCDDGEGKVCFACRCTFFYVTGTQVVYLVKAIIIPTSSSQQDAILNFVFKIILTSGKLGF